MAIQLNFKARYIIIFLVSFQCCPLTIVQTLHDDNSAKARSMRRWVK